MDQNKFHLQFTGNLKLHLNGSKIHGALEVPFISMTGVHLALEVYNMGSAIFASQGAII